MSRSEQERDTWNRIKGPYSKGISLGSRQMFALSCRIENDYGGKNGTYSCNVFKGVDESLLKRGLLERYIHGHVTNAECTTPLTHIQWSIRITESGLREFIQNCGEDIKVGIYDKREDIKAFLERTGWIKKEEWMKYMTLGYLPPQKKAS